MSALLQGTALSKHGHSTVKMGSLMSVKLALTNAESKTPRKIMAFLFLKYLEWKIAKQKNNIKAATKNRTATFPVSNI